MKTEKIDISAVQLRVMTPAEAAQFDALRKPARRALQLVMRLHRRDRVWFEDRGEKGFALGCDETDGESRMAITELRRFVEAGAIRVGLDPADGQYFFSPMAKLVGPLRGPDGQPISVEGTA